MGIFSREKEKSFFDQAKEEELNNMKLLANVHLAEMIQLKWQVHELTVKGEVLSDKMLNAVYNLRIRIKIANRAIQSGADNEQELIGLIKGYKLAIDGLAELLHLNKIQS